MDYPSSDYAAESWYKKALCFFMESPQADLDQENTLLAIDEFNRFIENFPRNELVPEAEKKIKELQEKLAYKEYKIAELYRKMKSYDAALIYYQSVIDDHSGPSGSIIADMEWGIVHVKLLERNLKIIRKMRKSKQPDTGSSRYIETMEAARSSFDSARNMFLLVVNSDADTDIKKKASQKLNELEQLESRL